MKVLYDVKMWNSYTWEHKEDEVKHQYFSSKAKAIEFIKKDIKDCLDEGVWTEEDIKNPKWNLWKAGDEYTWKIDSYVKKD